MTKPIHIIGAGMAGSEAATEALKHRADLAVKSLQELHLSLH